MKKRRWIAAMLCVGSLLTACGEKKTDAPKEMQYIKTSVFYATVMDMYQNPDAYLGGQYHFVGELYASTDSENGNVYYSVYGENPASPGSGIGIELSDCSFDGLEAGDTITVEGTLDSDKGDFEGEEREYLVLRVSSIEKRE